MSIILRGIEAVDSVSLNLISSAKELKTAVQYGDVMGATHAALEHTTGYTNAANYTATAINKGAAFASEFAQQLPFTVDPRIIHLLDGISITQAIGGLGIAISALTITANSILIYRDNQLLEEIPATSELKDIGVLKETVEKLETINYNQFKKTLPEYLRKKVESYGDENIFGHMRRNIEEGYDVSARDLLTEIQDHVTRSRVVHILALIGGLVALTAAIGLLVGFPPLLLTTLTVVGIMITITCVAMKKGWVENPKEGFNWKLLLPEFLQKKLEVDLSIEPEMKELELSSNIHDGITTLPHFITEKEDFITESVVFQEDVTDFLKPAEPEKELSFWEKLKAMFTKKKESPEPVVETPFEIKNEPTWVEASRPQGYRVHPLEDMMPASSLDHIMAEQGVLRMRSHRKK